MKRKQKNSLRMKDFEIFDENSSSMAALCTFIRRDETLSQLKSKVWGDGVQNFIESNRCNQVQFRRLAKKHCILRYGEDFEAE